MPEKIKKLMAMVLVGVMGLSMVACGASKNKEQLDGGDPSSWAPQETSTKADEQLEGGAPVSWTPGSSGSKFFGKIIRGSRL